jgi:uncharacterized protein
MNTSQITSHFLARAAIASIVLIAITASAALAPRVAQAQDAAPATASAKGKPQTGLPVATLRAGTQNIRAEIAATEITRNTGMMWRTSMGKNDGMLFIFDSPAYYNMWMRNTLIDLSVAYMDQAGKIVSIHEMKKLDEVTQHQAHGPVIYALEMNAGWFTRNNVKVGDTITGLEGAVAAAKATNTRAANKK